jgi:hypothetical protein
MTSETCKQCGADISGSIPYTICDTCKEKFCCDLTHTCYSEHRETCNSSGRTTIMNPDYMVNVWVKKGTE